MVSGKEIKYTFVLQLITKISKQKFDKELPLNKLHKISSHVLRAFFVFVYFLSSREFASFFFRPLTLLRPNHHLIHSARCENLS